MTSAPRVLSFLFVFSLLGGAARAAGNPPSCVNDIDCVATPACGGDVCDYPQLKCMPADASHQGSDGWCTVDTDCKCHADGATCVNSFCTFTVPKGGNGGASGGGAPGQGGAGQAGAPGSGGASGGSSATGGSAAGGSNDGGGCDVGGSGPQGLWLAAGVCSLAIAWARRRRRSA